MELVIIFLETDVDRKKTCLYSML